ncbi:hypothetical protein [Corynebacterium freneyi]|uniref:hypothetical protein n=1 Tax=Corynebacterium freneyi TaxID=134034 RepID=UPI001EF341D1|nr:hypothetical protein [Corynebacterium freneyi]MCG7440191.1 hypothetical protein [Corynebacterium freneyi]
MKKKGSFFPESWSDQKIADAISATIEHPEHVSEGEKRRAVYRNVDGVMVKVEWDLLGGESR